MRRQRGRVGFLVAMTIGLVTAESAVADVTTDRSASILVFPKVIANGTRDTVIQIGNTSNSLVRAHCFYVNAALTNPSLPQGPLNPPLWQEIDFTIQLTRQQPTQWTVSRGRAVDPTDSDCMRRTAAVVARGVPTREVCDSGFDPGKIPPVVPDFQGELKCIEVDDSGAPLSGNHLKGEATLVSEEDFQLVAPNTFTENVGTAKYNAIGVLGEENNGDAVLVLGGGQCANSPDVICGSDEDCGGNGPCVREYNACPQTWIVNHFADDAPDPVLQDTLVEGGSSSVTTQLTIVPCTQNFETQIPTRVTLQFDTTNEFESHFSVSTSVTCWGNFDLEELGAPALTFAGQLPDAEGTVFLQSRIRSAAGTPFGVLIVAEELHQARPSDTGHGETTIFGTRAAFNPQFEGGRSNPDFITIPADQLVP